MSDLLWRFYIWLRWGEVTEHVMDYIQHTPCEIEYRDKRGNVVGYWAYGHWNQYLPYKG